MKKTGRIAGWSCALLIFGTGLLLSPAARSVPPQQPAETHPSAFVLEGNPQLFATMCALYAAGYAQNVNLANSPLRQKLAAQLAAAKGPATDALRDFYHNHELGDAAGTLSQYISFAMVVGSPPKFAYTVSHDDLPPDVLPIEGFNDVLAAFYEEAQIRSLWRASQPEYDRAIAQFTAPVSRTVFYATSYLREVLQASTPYTFAVYIEPLVGEKTNFRSYNGHYSIVVSPSNEPPIDEIRHAFLHFMLEPVVLKNITAVMEKKPLLAIAGRAPRLPAEYRDDFTSFFIECLVRAAELRVRRAPSATLAAAMDQNDAEGFVLVRPIVRELQKFEQAEPAMSYYFPNLVRGINTQAETARLQNVKFAPAEEARATQETKAVEPPSELETWLQEGDRAIASKDGPAAEAAFQRVLAKYPDQPRALFGLAISSVMVGEVERARDLFTKLVAAAPTNGSEVTTAQRYPLILSWSHVYLGHFHDLDGKREEALKEYHAALEVEGAPEEARKAAQRGLEQAYGSGAKPKKPPQR